MQWGEVRCAKGGSEFSDLTVSGCSHHIKLLITVNDNGWVGSHLLIAFVLLH